MKRFLLAALAVSSLSVSANEIMVQRLSTDPNELITEVVVREVPEESVALPLWANDCSKMNRIHVFENLTWDQIVNVGQQIWNLVEKNKPVVNVEQPVAHALPMGLSCWADLDSWKAPNTKRYSVEYRNGFGGTPVRFDYRLHFTHGGGHSGKGRYLANVTVMPADLSVSWGYNFDAKVEVGQAVNVGSNASPIAGIELNVKWTVKTVLKEISSSTHLFVQGDGLHNVAR